MPDLIQNYGDPSIMIIEYGRTKLDTKLSLEQRLWKYSILTIESHIFWIGFKTEFGHGKIWHIDKMIGAHVASAYLYLPNFNFRLMTLHKPECNIPYCIAPAHLYQGLFKENARDMVIVGTHNMARKTHCPKGHEYTLKNTRVYKGSRNCRECDRLRNL